MNIPTEIVGIDLDNPIHLSALRELLNEYANSLEGGGAALPAENLDRLPATLAASGCYAGWLAFSDNRPAGLLNAFYGVSTFRAQPLLNIHDIVVSAGFRRRGIARQLLAAAEETARRRGCCKLTLEVLEGNAPAIAAYRQAGFAPYSLDPAMGRALFLEKKFQPQAANP
jgi:ribosomal protein S18 acetylase RimI-like enzyme